MERKLHDKKEITIGLRYKTIYKYVKRIAESNECYYNIIDYTDDLRVANKGLENSIATLEDIQKIAKFGNYYNNVLVYVRDGFYMYYESEEVYLKVDIESIAI